MAKSIIGNLHTPVDETTGERKVIHPITESDAVICNNGETLTDVLQKGKITIGDTKPENPGLWFNVTSSD
jgi:hypothetical protein